MKKNLLYALMASVVALLVLAIAPLFGAPAPTLDTYGSLGVIGLAGTTFLLAEPTVKNLIALGYLSATGQLNMVRRVVAKTADYAVLASDGSGTLFTNRGAAGTVIFTLPAPAAALAGYVFRFKAHADQTITVKTATADTLVVLNDAAADSLSLSTAGEKIGGEIEAFCDGTSWFASGVAVGHTYTIAT